MNIVIPMAGRGSRFADVGIETPKPLIDVRGRPMYSWAVDSLPLAHAERLIFVCLAEHLEAHPLREDIASRYAELNPEIIAVNQDPASLPPVLVSQTANMSAAKRAAGAEPSSSEVTAQVFARPLHGGALAVVLLNRG